MYGTHEHTCLVGTPWEKNHTSVNFTGGTER
jgi:hypothetical protein